MACVGPSRLRLMYAALAGYPSCLRIEGGCRNLESGDVADGLDKILALGKWQGWIGTCDVADGRVGPQQHLEFP